MLAVYDVGNLEEIKKYNSITVDGDGRITFFEEKPKNPTSTFTGIALYYYPKVDVAARSSNTLLKGTIPTSPAGSSNGFIRANAVLHLERSRHLVRHRLQGNA